MIIIRAAIGSRVSAVIAGAVLTVMAAAPAAAQSSAPLDQALKVAATAAASEAPAAAEPQAAAPAENPVLKFFAGTELSGFVDTYYSYNFNKPQSPCGTVGGVAIFNCLHNFDVAHNSFSLNLAELALEKKPTPESRGGFRVDLDYGQAAGIVAGFEPTGSSTTVLNQNIQQAYASYLAPAGKGTIQLDFGKFVTQHGAEVIETKDNWNYSRSLLFALAIPYYHMGVRLAYNPNDKMTFGANISNGWNNVVDNNTGKTAGFMAILKPTSALTYTANYMVGPELTGTNDSVRNLFDTTIAYTVNPQTSVMANYDFGKEASSTWQGIGVYLKYQPNAWFAVIPRYEYFNDKDGWALIGQNVQEFTLTAELKHKDGVMMRVEYRGDFTQDPFFLKNTSDLVKTQNALTIGWIYAFSSKAP